MSIFIIAIFLFFHFSCDTNDDNPNQIEGELGNGETTALVNGESFEAPPGSTGGLLQPEAGGSENFYLFNITALVSLNNSGSDRNIIALGLVGSNTDDIEAGTVWLANGTVRAYTGSYSEVRNEEIKVLASSKIGSGDSFKLTAIDTEAKTISGEFSFSGEDLYSGNTYTVTNGKFKNVSYSEL
ncbi:hypothetical protein DHD80_09855 [Gramella sp. AN32]|nr:hypothetical protein [Gramella sp. AN32]